MSGSTSFFTPSPDSVPPTEAESGYREVRRFQADQDVLRIAAEIGTDLERGLHAVV